MNDGDEKTSIRKRLVWLSLVTLHFGHRPAVLLAFGLVLGELEGWKLWFVWLASFAYVMDGVLSSFAKHQQRQRSSEAGPPDVPRVNGTIMLDDAQAQQMLDVLQTVAASSKPMGPLQ
jgi:hypothetical protein